ncbi:MAG: hypothetical protein R3B84_21870 [Zavarzinella sp.]
MLTAAGFLTLALVILITLVWLHDKGFHRGLRISLMFAFLLVPWWLQVQVRSIEMNAATTVGLTVLAIALFRPFQGLTTRWIFADLIVGLLVATTVISDLNNKILIPTRSLEVALTWLLPYVMGRLFIQKPEDLLSVLPYLCIFVLLIGGYALVEAFGKKNVLADLLGMKWERASDAELYRWGLLRARGHTTHPIYFGLLMVLVLPWLLLASRQTMRGYGQDWWIATIPLAALATFVTVSRAAQLAMGIVFGADLFFRHPRWRAPMFLMALVAFGGFVAFRAEILDALSKYAGETDTAEHFVVIEGKKHPYSGTLHRDLLDLVYARAIDECGWFGYGSTLKDIPVDSRMDERFKSIDNHYLKILIINGYVGVFTLAVLIALGCFYLAAEALYGGYPVRDWAGGMFGAFLAVAIALRGVAFEPDFSCFWMFTIGVAGSLRTARLRK